MLKKGAQILVETLIEQGVDTVFGYPGGAVLDIYDALREKQDKIRHIITAHEQGAAHAADGYARATGRVGVVLATSGPGATNLVTGIAAANMDSVPLVAITGNVSSNLMGLDSFQEVDIAGIVMPITKHSFIVKDIAHLQEAVRQAFKIAMSGRPGAVLVDITRDAMAAQTDYQPLGAVEKRRIKTPPKEKFEEAASVINGAKRPVILYGGGVNISRAGEALLALAKKNDIPICHTLMGLGAIDSAEEHNLGLAGTNGRYSANKAIYNADVLIAVGTRFSDRVVTDNTRFASDAIVVHIDIDVSEIDKNLYCLCGLAGDAREVLEELTPLICKRTRRSWRGIVAEWKRADYQPEDSEHLTPRQIVNVANEYVADGGMIVTDVGQHQVWTAQYSDRLKPGRFITSGGLGAMGFGLGASIGAKLAYPERRVVLCTGDGSFHMNMNELSTCVRSGLDIVILIFDNGSLGMVRQLQEHLCGGRYFATEVGWQTDYIKLAEAFGGKGYRVTTKQELEQTLKKVEGSHTVTVIDCVINREEEVLPIILAGTTVDDTIK